MRKITIKAAFSDALERYDFGISQRKIIPLKAHKCCIYMDEDVNKKDVIEILKKYENSRFSDGCLYYSKPFTKDEIESELSRNENYISSAINFLKKGAARSKENKTQIREYLEFKKSDLKI